MPLEKPAAPVPERILTYPPVCCPELPACTETAAPNPVSARPPDNIIEPATEFDEPDDNVTSPDFSKAEPVVIETSPDF